jgi:hypothetical protein
VQIPRCRATVSEDIVPGHWSSTLGRPGARILGMGLAGDGAPPDTILLLASQETGANCQHQPLSRLKEE